MLIEDHVQCRKSMARIKGVLAERRNAALQAAQIVREREEAEWKAQLAEQRARSEEGRKRKREETQRKFEAKIAQRQENKGRRARARAEAAAKQSGAAQAQEARPAAQILEPGTGGLTETLVEEQARAR